MKWGIGIIFSVLALVALVLPATASAYCYNTTVANDTLTRGTVNASGNGVFTDNCTSETTLYEYFCPPWQSDFFQFWHADCTVLHGANYVCENGACVEGTPQISCSETDNGFDINNSGITTDTMNGSLEDNCASASTLIEYYCYSPTEPMAWSYVNCDTSIPGTECRSGACVPATQECTETDGGKDIFNSGVTTDYLGNSYTDLCVDSENILEFYCLANGSAESDQLSCGTDYYIGAYYCINDQGNSSVYRNYRNFFCSGDDCEFVDIPMIQEVCDGGCVNGSCVQNNTCTPGWECNGSSRIYRYEDCTWGQEEHCDLGCENGECNECVDSDGGVNPFVFGTCRDFRGATVNDACLRADGSGPLASGAYAYEAFCLTDDMVEHCWRVAGNSQSYCENLERKCYAAPLLPNGNLAWTYFDRSDDNLVCPFGCASGICNDSTGNGSMEMQTFSDIEEGATNTVDFNGSYIESIDVDVGAEATVSGTTNIVITESPDIPAGVPDEPAEAAGYIYLDIEPSENIESEIESVTIDFKVPVSWLTQKGVDPMAIVMNELEDGSWKPLATAVTGNDAQYYYYSATALHLSPHLITGSVTGMQAAPGFEFGIAAMIITLVLVGFLGTSLKRY